MKLLAFFVACVLLIPAYTQAIDGSFFSVSGRTNLAATFINDSVIVDLDESDFEEPADEEGVNSIPENESTIETVVFTDDDDSSGNVIDEVVIIVSDTGDVSDLNNGASSNNNQNSGGGSEPSVTSSESKAQKTVSAQSILSTLTGSQAVTRVDTSVADGGFSTSVSGARTREALLSRKITNLSIPKRPSQNNSSTANRVAYSRDDLALIVSAQLVKNPELEDVFYTTDALTVTYKARGRLLFTLPVPYTALLELQLNETTTNKRVRLKFPWYTFFTWTGVSKSALQEAVDEIIIAAPEGKDYDRATQVFEEVSSLLKSTQGFRGLQ